MSTRTPAPTPGSAASPIPASPTEGSPMAPTTPDPDRDARRAYRRRRLLLRLGQALMAAGALVGAIHWAAHLAPPNQQPPGITDLLAGYPTAGILFVAGAIIAGQKR